MSLIAPYVDGKLQTTTASTTSLSSSNAGNDTINSDTFLTLLVAEMQNQDPLEPTSNTEWVSQYATFTQVEQIGEMADSMDVLRANSLVGKEVIMKVTSEATGETTYERGIVDYIVLENGNALLNINGSNYALSDLDTVASEEYFVAYDFYNEFIAKLDALPNLNAIDATYEGAIKELYDMYTGMTEYQQNYMKSYAAVYIENYNSYIEKMKDYGISYETEETEETATSLDDILEAFNKKMDELITQMGSIESSVSAGNTSSSGSTTDNTDTQTDTVTADGTTDSEDEGDTTTETKVETDAVVNADGTTTIDTTTTTTTTTTTETGSTTSTESSTTSQTIGTADSEETLTEEVLNLLTQESEAS